MDISLTWVEVLNTESEWNNSEDCLSWFTRVLSHQAKLSAQSIQEFQERINFIRAQIGKLHFSEPLDIATINRHLNGIKMEIIPFEPKKNNSAHGRKVAQTKGAYLPLFRAHVNGADDEALLKSLGLTLLFQFAEFAGKALASPNPSKLLCRCEGLIRPEHPGGRQPEALTYDDLEIQFRREIPLLVESKLLEDKQIQRCADLFVVRPKAKFCCDACRFSTFQITKQIKEPGYLAEKQRRYRERIKS